jgi:hypothetical protein
MPFSVTCATDRTRYVFMVGPNAGGIVPAALNTAVRLHA